MIIVTGRRLGRLGIEGGIEGGIGRVGIRRVGIRLGRMGEWDWTKPRKYRTKPRLRITGALLYLLIFLVF